MLEVNVDVRKIKQNFVDFVMLPIPTFNRFIDAAVVWSYFKDLRTQTLLIFRTKSEK